MNIHYFILEITDSVRLTAYNGHGVIGLCPSCDEFLSLSMFHWEFEEFNEYKLYATIDNFQFTQLPQVFL